MATTYDPIASTTLTSSASSVTFSSLDTIAAGYRDLVLVVAGVTLDLAAGDIWLRFNSDSGNNYTFVRMSGNGSTTSSSSETAAGAYINIIARPDTSVGFQSTTQIFDFSQTDKHKSALTRADKASLGTDCIANRWANTSAITSIQVIPTNALQSLQAGSTFSLYGIVAV